MIAHGGGPAWDAQVETVAGLVKTGGPVEVSFLMGPGAKDHRFQDAAKRLADQGVSEIVVVPVLVSTGSVSREKLPRDLAGLPMVYEGDALLPHPGMAKWVEARVRDARSVASK